MEKFLPAAEFSCKFVTKQVSDKKEMSAERSELNRLQLFETLEDEGMVSLRYFPIYLKSKSFFKHWLVIRMGDGNHIN